MYASMHRMTLDFHETSDSKIYAIINTGKKKLSFSHKGRLSLNLDQLKEQLRFKNSKFRQASIFYQLNKKDSLHAQKNTPVAKF